MKVSFKSGGRGDIQNIYDVIEESENYYVVNANVSYVDKISLLKEDCEIIPDEFTIKIVDPACPTLPDTINTTIGNGFLLISNPILSHYLGVPKDKVKTFKLTEIIPNANETRKETNQNH